MILCIGSRVKSVRVNCVYDLLELFKASKYSKNFPSVVQC